MREKGEGGRERGREGGREGGREKRGREGKKRRENKERSSETVIKFQHYFNSRKSRELDCHLCNSRAEF